MGVLGGVFGVDGFVPRWQCGLWPTWLGYLHIVADVVIFLSYAAIPAALAVLVLRRRDSIRLTFVMWLFVAFILSCGITHLVEAVIFYRPLYRLSAVLKAETAVVSALTAVVLVRRFPSLLSLPRMRDEKEALEHTLAAERGSAASLADARLELEARNSELTLRLRRAMTAMNAAEACACRWDVATGTVDWEKGYAHMQRLHGGGLPATFTSWADLIGPEAADRLLAMCRDVCERDEPLEFQLNEILPGRDLRMRALAEPPVRGQERTMVGMFRIAGRTA